MIKDISGGIAKGIAAFSLTKTMQDLMRGDISGADISSNKLAANMLKPIAEYSIDVLLSNIAQQQQQTRGIITAYRTVPASPPAAPGTISRLDDFITRYTATNPLPMYGGGRRRVTRRRLTGSKRRKAQRKTKINRHQ